MQMLQLCRPCCNPAEHGFPLGRYHCECLSWKSGESTFEQYQTNWITGPCRQWSQERTRSLAIDISTTSVSTVIILIAQLLGFRYCLYWPIRSSLAPWIFYALLASTSAGWSGRSHGVCGRTQSTASRRGCAWSHWRKDALSGPSANKLW